jgi:Ca-activated chloride channel family protein
MKLPAPANPRALTATAAFASVVIVVLAVAAPGLHAASSTNPAGSILTLGTPRSGCTSLLAAVPPDDIDGVVPVLAAYDTANRQVNGHCVDVRVLATPAGTVADALVQGWKTDTYGPAPDIWLPGASSWVVLTRARTSQLAPDLIPLDNPSFAQSPFVIAMPRPMAQALGWPARSIGFTDLVAIGADPRGWGAAGHPEWGTLRLGKTNPLLSTTGLEALIAAYFAASHVSQDLTLGNLTDPTVIAFVKGVELATVHYGQSSTTFLQNLAQADSAGDALKYVSAIALDERHVSAYNAGRIQGMNGHAPSVPLAAIYPKEGTLVSDNPFVALNGSWVTSDQKAAAADVLAFLMAPAQQAALRRAGYRDAAGQPESPSTGADGTLTDEPKVVIKPPSGTVLDKLQASWWTVRKPARVLIIVDVSGSMDDQVTPNATKLDLVKAALLGALGQVGDDDEVGLWSFSDQHTELVPIGRVGSQRDRLKEAVGKLQAGGGTLLYSTVEDGWKFMSSTNDATHINAVVVLTDGQDNGSPSAVYGDLTNKLHTQSPENAVKVFTVAYGADADRSGLRGIAQASRADAYDATDPTLIREVFIAVLSNF